MKTKLNPRNYYKTIENAHATGDIWKDFPTLGLLKQKNCSAIIITPGCDLANAKVETITFLPIVPIKSFFTSRSFYYEVRAQFLNLSIEIIPNIKEYLLKNRVPSAEDISVLSEIITSSIAKDKSQIRNRLLAGLSVLKTICSSTENKFILQDYKTFFTDKRFNNICIEIIRNSYSNDLHFLPKDQEDEKWSSIKEDSVILFRYPSTIPIELLDLANNTELPKNWKDGTTKIAEMYPVVLQFQDIKPLKTLSINGDFLSDILTRYCSLYIRIGSPDFTHDTIVQISKRIIE